jgi:uncharacterized protein
MLAIAPVGRIDRGRWSLPAGLRAAYLTGMTGATDHAGLIVLSFDECIRLVAGSTVGRIGFVTGGEVEILPVNHLVDGSTVAFRTLYGSKLGAAAQNAAVSFEADGYDAEGSGWSVLIKGRAEVVTDPALLNRLERKGLRTYVTSVPQPQWVLIRPDAISGRRVPEGG